jgi:predicted RNA-binding Zn ribbon-like protein
MADDKSAPGGLALVQDFVNTAEWDEGRDDLATPDGLTAWLASRGLAGDLPDEDDLRRAIRLREAIRGLCLANNGGSLRDEDLLELNQTVQAARLRPRFLPGATSELEPGTGGLEGALGRVVGAIHEAMALGTWGRLKACRSESCQYAFYDHTRNRGGAWCSMATCGNREKARRFRTQRRGATPPGT